MTAYHLFREGDASFVYHLASGRFIRVSPAAYDLLALREKLSAADAEAAFRARHPGETGVLDDVSALEEDGFFEPAEEPVLDDAAFEKELAKRLTGPCNTLVLSVASGCNLACRYCYCGVCRDELPSQGLMSEETALLAVERLFAVAAPKMSVRVTFFGGEPLLNKQVIRRVVAHCNELAAARGQNVGYSITTNGTLVDDEMADLIVTNNFGLMVSLDGPQALHDRQCPMRDGQGSFAAATVGIRRLLARGAHVTVRCTMAHPAPDALALIRFFADFGVSRVVLGTVYNPMFPSACDFTAEDDRAFRRRMGEAVIPWMLAERAAGRMPIYDPFDEIGAFQGEKTHPEKVPGLRCGACRGAMAVGPDGTLYPCHRFVGMEKWALGRLVEGPDRTRCEAFWRGYRAAMKGACGACWAYRVCGGPCPWEIACADGTFKMTKRLCEDTCAWVRQGVYYLAQADLAGLDPKGAKENDDT